MSRLKAWFRPAEESTASERVAWAMRWGLVGFVLLVNNVPGLTPYSGATTLQWVFRLAVALGAVNLLLTFFVWWPRRKRKLGLPLPRALGLFLQFLDIAFISALLSLPRATEFRETPFEILYFLVIPLAALRFGFFISILFSLLVAVVYSGLVMRLPIPGAFSTIDVRNAMLAVRVVAFLSVGVVGGILAQLERTQRRRGEEERRRMRELEVVQRFAEAISGTLELDRLMEQVFVSLQELIPFMGGEITLWEGAEGSLVSRSVFAPQGYARREVRYAPGEGYSGWMAVHRKPLWIPDVAAEKHVRPKGDFPYASYLGVPLLLGDRLVGTLELFGRSKGGLAREDREILVATSSQIAAMLEHARLYDQVRERLERRGRQLDAIEQIDRELSGTLDLQKVIQAVLDRSMEFTGADVGILLGMTDQRDGLLILASQGYPEGMVARFSREPWPLEAGIVGRVARANQPLLLEDVSQDPDYFDATGRTVAELAIPISHEEEVLGVLNLESGWRGAFDQEDLEFVQHLAEHAAIAIENARLFDREQRRARELTALHEVGLEISQQLEMADVLRSVVERGVRLLDATSGSLYVLDAAAGELEMAVNHNMSPEFIGTRLKLGEGLAGRVAQTRRPLTVDDYRSFPGRSAQFVGSDVRAVIGVPLLYGDEVMGVLDVLHGVEGRTFDERDVRLLLLLANQAAIAIANARLFQETRRRAEQMSALQDVSQMLVAALGTRETLEALIRGLEHLIPHQGGEVCLFDPQRQVFTPEATLGETALSATAEVYTLDEGYTGWIGRNRRPLLVEDCITFSEARPKRTEVLESGRLRSYLGVPMLLGDRLVGTLELLSNRPRAFDQEHLRMLVMVAGQAAAAIDNARLYELTERRLRRRVDQLVALRRLGQEMNNTLELEHNLQVLLEESLRATPSTHGNVAMYDGTAGAFRVTDIQAGYDPEEARLLRQLRLGRGRSMVDDVVRSGQPEIVQDAQVDERPICVKRGTRSALSVPILFEGRVVGVINLLSMQARSYGEEDMQFVQTMAAQGSLAVGNARRHEELVQQRELVSQRATQLREILELGNTLRADRDLDDILSQVAYGVVGSAGFGLVIFNLVSQENPQELVRAAGAGIPLEDLERIRQVRPQLQLFRNLFREDCRVSRSYFLPQESGLVRKEEVSYLFPGAEYEAEVAEDDWHLGDLLLVPMNSSAGELLGVMTVDNPFDRKRPARRTVEALEIFANQAAIAVENSRLFRERERRIAELNVLNRISQATTSTLDLDLILRSIYERLAEARVIEVESFYIAIYDAERDRLRYDPVVDRGVLYSAAEGAVEGVVGRIVRAREAVLIEDMAQAERNGRVEIGSLSGRPGEHSQSYLGVPMLVGAELVGVIAAQSRRKAAYAERDKQFLLTVANQVAVAIQNARLFREREQRLAELAILNEVGRTLSSALQLDQLLEAVHQQVSRIFDTTNFYIATYEEGADEWTLVFTREHGERQAPARHKVGVGLTGYIIRNRTPVLLHSLRENVSFHEAHEIPFVGEQARCWLGVPLISADKVVGVMAVQSYEQENLYTEQDLALLSTIGAQAAIAIDNARLFTQAQQSAQRSQALYEVSRALSSYLQEEPLMRAILEAISRTLGCVHASIAIVDEESRTISTRHMIYQGEYDRFPEWVQKASYPLDSPDIIADVVRSGRTEIIAGWDERFNREIYEKYGHERLLRVWMPIKMRDRVVGMMEVGYDREKKEAVSEEEVQLLAAFMDQAAVALESARLFEETRQRLQQVNALLEVSRDVATQLDVPLLLQSILESAVNSVPAAERGSILLLDEKTQDLVVTAQIGYTHGVWEEIRLGMHEGFAGWVCREGRADIVADASSDPRFVVTESSKDIRSIMSAPLIGRRGLVGVINLDNLTRTHAFGRPDLEFLSGLAHQAAVAIENARLFEERERQARVLEARVRELSALLEGTRAITSTLEIRDMLESLVGVVGRQMEVATVSLWLVEGEEIVPVAAVGLPGSFAEVRLRKGEGLSGQVVASGEVLAIRDVTELPESMHSPTYSALDQQLDLHAYLGVPISYQERVLGVLSAMAHEARDFLPEEVALLTGLAEQAGVAVENARLFRERELRVAELMALNEVGRAISSTMRLQDLLETIRREAGRLVDTSNFMMALYDERTDTVTFPVYHEFGRPAVAAPRQGGNGLTEYVIRQRGPVLVSGDSESFCREHGIDHVGQASKSWLGVPLIFSERVIGVIGLQDYEQAGAYDEHHLRLLSTIASQAAVAIQNARLFSDLEASRTELEARLIQLGALQDMGRTISGTLEMDSVVGTVLEAVTMTIGFSYAMISLVDEKAGQVCAVRGIGVSPDQVKAARKPLDSSDIMADIVRSGRTEVIDGWDERFDRGVFEQFGHADLVRVFAPLLARGRVIGLIEAGYPRAVRAQITSDDIEVLQTFLGQASIAIENARLFEEIRRFTEELEEMVRARTQQLQDEKNRLEALHAITTELSSSLDLDEILLKTIDLASMTTGRSMGMVLLRDIASGDLVCRARLDEGNVLRPGRQVIPLAEVGALRQVLEEREALRIADTKEDARSKGLPALPAGARSAAAVPLVTAEEVVGLILLTHSQVDFFDEDQMRLLLTLGAEVAAAIHNAELYSFINDQALRLSDMLTFQQEEASKVRAILQSITDGVVVVDREDRILLANPAVEQILGIPRGEMEGRSTRELPGLFFPGGVFAQESRRFELMDRYISVHSAPVVTDTGDVLGNVFIMRDITREVEADRAKSEFVSTVSHELRTPLTSIKGYVDLILLGSVGEISPMQRNFLDVVRSNANRLVDLINDLLDISRIETGRISLNPEPVSMSDLVEEVVDSARTDIERKQLTVEVTVPPDLPLVHADRKRLAQVLINLVSNAYKYTREGGRVSISARTGDGYVQVDVSDTGVGISAEDQKRLFTRFFRADNPLRDEVGGTGLGLAISRSFVELHGGKMWVESELNVGSTFSFTLPLPQTEQPAAGREVAEMREEPAGRPVARRPARVLVVDDEPNIADLLRYQLERAGYQVLTANRGEKALEVACAEHPDLITLDILMVGMDGFEVLERLKADDRTADIPVVIISVVAEKKDLMAMGAVDFLPKPLDEGQLLATIGHVLNTVETGRTVLVVDDDPDILGWLRRVLEEEGFQVQEASDGLAALESVSRSRPDLILLDMRLPRLDGREVIERLKLDEETRDIPIIVITASSVDKEKDRVRMLGLGAESFLTKPFTAEELAQEIERSLKERMEASTE